MKKLLARRERYGWTWPELSRRCGLPVWKLHYWRRQLAGQKKPARKRRPPFFQVEVTEASGRQVAPPLELLTASGVRIVVGAEFDPEHLRRVLHALEHGC